MTNTVLRIDLGTQVLKVVFYDLDRREIVATGSALLDLHQTDEGVAEQEAVWWLQSMCIGTPLEFHKTRQRYDATAARRARIAWERSE